MLPINKKIQKIIEAYKIQEQVLMQQCGSIKAHLESELKKHTYLSECLNDYRSRLKPGNVDLIYGHEFNQYQAFMGHLGSVISQLQEEIEKLRSNYFKVLSEYQVVKNRIDKLSEMFDNEIKDLQNKEEKKDTQLLMDIYNTHKKSE